MENTHEISDMHCYFSVFTWLKCQAKTPVSDGIQSNHIPNYLPNSPPHCAALNMLLDALTSEDPNTEGRACTTPAAIVPR